MKRRGTDKAPALCDLEIAYKQCLERERIRERDWRRTNQGAFEAGLLHLDFEEEERECTGSAAWLSDRGRGAADVREIDSHAPTDTRQQRINWAKHRIMREEPDCLEVFWLVLRNGKKRGKSIAELMLETRRNYEAAKAVYWYRLKKLKILFGAL